MYYRDSSAVRYKLTTMRFTLYYLEDGVPRKYKRYLKSEGEALKMCERFKKAFEKGGSNIVLQKLVQEEVVIKEIKTITLS